MRPRGDLFLVDVLAEDRASAGAVLTRARAFAAAGGIATAAR